MKTFAFTMKLKPGNVAEYVRAILRKGSWKSFWVVHVLNMAFVPKTI